MDLDRAPHDGLVPGAARRAPLAPGVVGPSLARAGAGAGVGARAAGVGQRIDARGASRRLNYGGPMAAGAAPGALGQVASSKPSSASANAPACAAPNGSRSTITPTSAAATGNSTVNTPARDAGTWRRPRIHSHTVATLAASE